MPVSFLGSARVTPRPIGSPSQKPSPPVENSPSEPSQREIDEFTEKLCNMEEREFLNVGYKNIFKKKQTYKIIICI